MSEFSAALRGLLERPQALARFHDGEYRVLRAEPYRARSGWTTDGQSWLRERLEAALGANHPGYIVGVSPPCDFPEGTAYYLQRIRAPRTYATVFSHANYERFRSWFASQRGRITLVGCGHRATYRVPADGVTRRWDLDGLVKELGRERQPIFVAAGPAAAVIVESYWRLTPKENRQMILDVGSAVDQEMHGRNTRDHHEVGSPLQGHECSWEETLPWAQRKPRKERRGWSGHLDRRRQRS